VREIGRRCNGQPRSGDYCETDKPHGQERGKNKNSHPRSSEPAMTKTTVQKPTRFIASLPPI
jgi:hypothetical protein